VDLLDQVYVSDELRSARTPPPNPGVHDVEIVWSGPLINVVLR
jgi:hypothetical protein